MFENNKIKALFILIIFALVVSVISYLLNIFFISQTLENAIDNFYKDSFLLHIFYSAVSIIPIAYIFFVTYNKTRTKLERKNEELERSNHILKQYKKAIDESNIVTIGDLKGNITYVNDKFCECTYYSKEEVLNKPHNLLRGDYSKEIFKELWQTIQSKKVWKGILKNKKKDGEFYYVDITIMPILDENNEIIEYIAIRHEITELIHKTEELEKSLKEDYLTKKGNRYKLLEDINSSNKPYLALLDINNFNEINDFYGHMAGDNLLKIIAEMIENMLPKKEYMLYRVYADEFAILGDGIDKNSFVQDIKTISDKISSQPVKVHRKEIYIQTNFSLSFEEKNDLLKSANIIKKYSKNNKEIYIYDKTLGLEDVYEKNILWTLKIKKALEDDKIIPYFQPIYNLHTGKIEKYESLVRLIEDNIAISPYYFLDIAKKSKQYFKITKRVIEKSFEYFEDKDYEFSVNLTIEDIKNKEVSDFIIEKLKNSNIASKVVFEIVESEGIESFEEINIFIATVKDLGSKIAIDDFGSGYSNFEYLIKLNADYIKIDGSLIKDIVTNKNTQEIVKTIVDFAKRQDFKTIAEFVSSKEILDKIREFGLDYAQGYYIGEPKNSLLDI